MPTRQQLRPSTDPILTSFGLEYSQNSAVSAVEALFPPKPSKGSTGAFFVYDANYLVRHYDDRRAHASPANAIDLRLTKDTYACERYDLRFPIADDDREDQIGPVDLDQDATRTVTESLNVAREIRARDMLFNTTATYVPTAFEGAASPLWDATSCHPVADSETVAQAVQSRTGHRPNLLVLPPGVFKVAKNEANSLGAVLADRLKYTMGITGQIITPALIGNLLDIPNVIVPDMIYSTTAMSATVPGINTTPGTTTAANAGITDGKYIWDYKADGSTAAKGVIFAYVDKSAGPRGMTFGWSFQSDGYGVRRYRDDERGVDWIEAGRREVQKITCLAALYRYTVLT